MCQYKHSPKLSGETLIAATNNVPDVNIEDDTDIIDNAIEDKQNEVIIEGEEYDYDIFEEAKELFCNKYCYPIYETCIHYNCMYEEYFDKGNIIELRDLKSKEVTLAVHCKWCGEVTYDAESHSSHMETIHSEKD